MWSFVALGLGMGLSAGVSPGPLLALVVTAALRGGLAAGLRVALAPLVTDLPIVALAVAAAGRLPPSAMSWVGMGGALVVVWLGVETLRAARRAVLPERTGAAINLRRELWRGAVVNALNPHPWLFWATVGGPTLVRGWRASPWYGLGFLLGFYVLLIGSKVVVAWLVSRQAGGLSLTWYRRILAGCGLMMLGMAVLLAAQSWSLRSV